MNDMTLDKTNETGAEAEITLPGELVFPEEYFCGLNEAAPGEKLQEPILQFAIDDRRLEKLKKIAIWLEVELPELLLGAYLYLLGEISEQPKIEVQTILTDNEQVFPLRVNHTGIANLPDLCRMVKQKCAEPSKPELYSLTQLGNMQLKKSSQGIIPFFCWDEPAQPSSAKQVSPQRKAEHQKEVKATGEQIVAAQFDLRLCLRRVPEARIRAGRVSFSCGFNQRRLRKDMVEKFVHAYLNLIDMMIEKMESGGLLR